MKIKNNYMNLVKALGIIAVVIGHCNLASKQYVYLYHMALFFFASGYFYNDKYSKNPISYITKKFKTNYFIYVKYCLIFLLFRKVFLSTFIYSRSDVTANTIIYSIKEILTLNYSEPLLGTVWFIVTLFYVVILYNLISYICYKITSKRNEEVKLIVLLILFSYGFLTIKYNISLYQIIKPDHILLFKFIFKLISPKVLITLFIYHLGFIYKQNENKVTFKFNYLISCIILLILSSKYGNIGIAGDQFVNPAFFISCSLLGIYINVYFAKFIYEKYENNLLHYIGNNTLSIMIFHFLSFKLVTLMIIHYYHYPLTYLSKFPAIYDIGGIWWILYTLVGIFVPLLFSYIFDKIKSSFTLIKNYKYVYS